MCWDLNKGKPIVSQYVFVLFLKFSLATQIREAVFYGQADCKGGVTDPILTVSKCENVDLFSPWNMIL